MVASKNQYFNEEQRLCADFFRAVAHPARVQILHYLAETQTCITGDISKELPLGRTTVNQHLKILKKTGLIQGYITGKKTNYCLNPQKVKEFKALAGSFLDEVDIESEFVCNPKNE